MRFMIQSIMLILFLSVLTVHANDKNARVVSFQKAKKNLYTKVYGNAGETIYCDCKWSNRKVDLNSCGLQSFFQKKHRKRALRTEAEHVIPASWMLKKDKAFRQCAIDAKMKNESARKYCQKHDLEYKRAHNDLTNLRPSVGQINAVRSNKPFVDSIDRGRVTFGQRPVVMNTRGFLPEENDRGDIARIALYMSDTYGVIYSKRQQALFKKWDKLDPPTVAERALHKRIIDVQGFGLKLAH